MKLRFGRRRARSAHKRYTLVQSSSSSSSPGLSALQLFGKAYKKKLLAKDESLKGNTSKLVTLIKSKVSIHFPLFRVASPNSHGSIFTSFRPSHARSDSHPQWASMSDEEKYEYQVEADGI